MEIQFIAQSGFIITLDNGEVLTIDLWSENPVYPVKVKNVPKTNYIFITHDHSDHDLPTGLELAKRDKSFFLSNYEIARKASSEGLSNAVSANIGSLFEVGGIKVALVHAEHSSDTGLPVGFIIKTEKFTIYHMGDTGYFTGLDVLSEIYDIDILMVPIGGTYTMSPVEASYAVRDINPTWVIPIHYNTFPKISQDPEDFRSRVKNVAPATKVIIMEPGQVWNVPA
ncbi:metal-dependent hydrolase [Candidatus Dojkabacteria bacterium]|uniref:Metal-dependent hydrolase n=1 Tax=Candidatus Dojkabacteria bacterium TaxID=2099670 RepID=A0A955HXJ2_9BACT|nr:metal-dependent hydrolase [Candidatus Dojkabacteria bacterium]MCB9790507.1 metal-dependent hydrolase [Candidatus Nomurabacteria bacterium]